MRNAEKEIKKPSIKNKISKSRDDEVKIVTKRQRISKQEINKAVLKLQWTMKNENEMLMKWNKSDV